MSLSHACSSTQISERSPSIPASGLIIRFYTFPNYIENTTFGISCDAFANMKECLTKHKAMVAQYLDSNSDRVGSPLLGGM